MLQLMVFVGKTLEGVDFVEAFDQIVEMDKHVPEKRKSSQSC